MSKKFKASAKISSSIKALQTGLDPEKLSASAIAERLKRFEVELVNIERLRAPTRQVRRHSERQLVKLQAIMKRFGFLWPLLVTVDNELVNGVARVEVVRRLGCKLVPVIRTTDMSPEDGRVFRIADNRLAELSEWDDENLNPELKELSQMDLGYSLEFTGFDTAEIDLRIDGASTVSAGADQNEVEVLPPAKPVTRTGDIWRLGDHMIACGNSLEDEVYRTLMGNEQARMVVADPPYNVKIEGHVGGLGKIHHRPFAMACGEMSEEDFIKFLTTVLILSRRYLMRGGLAYYCMDFRHCHEMTSAQRLAGFDLINLCVWAKTNGGMGSLYRNRHELIFIFGEKGESPVNNVQLGRFGRYRTNVWDYAGANTFRKGRDQDLADHPTVKPTEMIADAIRDVTHRGDTILDPFLGSGTTVLAAERTGRRARGIEIDPGYVDVAIRRWSNVTGQRAILIATGQTFEEVSAHRQEPPPIPADGAETPKAFRVRHRTRRNSF